MPTKPTYEELEQQILEFKSLESEHTQAEAMAERKVGMYEQIFNINTAVKLIINPNSGRIIEANLSAESFYGYSISELKEMNISEINCLDEPTILEEMQKAKAEKRLFFNFQHKLKSGEIRDVEVYSGPINLEEETLLHSIIIDVTERKQAEEELSRVSSILMETEIISKVGGWRWDLKSQKMFWTDETYRIHEIDPADVEPGSEEHIERGMRCYEEKDRQIIQEAFQKCAQDGIGYDMEFPFTTFKGKKLLVRTAAQAEKENGKVIRIIGNIMDITERKQLEGQLRESQRLVALGTVVGGVAHEFNNALQSLFLYAGLVKDQLPEEQDIRDNFEHLLGTANDAKHLVEQVMLISSRNSGHPEPIDLSELIHDVLEQKMTLGLDASRVELTLAEGCPPVIADKKQLRTALINVIDNAILAIANGGELSVSLEYNEYATEKAIQAKQVQLTITDTGVGMTEEILGQAFNPFFTTREIGQGKGFGLSIVYNILQNMGGSISAASVFGEGSSFVMEFPIGNIVEN